LLTLAAAVASVLGLAAYDDALIVLSLSGVGLGAALAFIAVALFRRSWARERLLQQTREVEELEVAAKEPEPQHQREVIEEIVRNEGRRASRTDWIRMVLGVILGAILAILIIVFGKYIPTIK
jgi:hypothetical protein